jgi:polar amino acid transport system substrate-binding protein
MRTAILLLAAACLAIAPLAGQSKTLTAVTDAWPPFIDADRIGQGLSMEIIRSALGSEGYTVSLQIMPWQRALQAVTDAVADLLPEVWITPERKSTFLFSEAYATNDIVFIKRKGDPFEYTGLASLAGKTVGTVRGYGYDAAFLAAGGFTRLPSYDLATNVRRLLAGNLDLTLEDRTVAMNLLRETDPILLDSIEFTHTPLCTNSLHIAVGLRNPRAAEIVAAFNRGLAAMRADGRLAAILKEVGAR